MSRTSTMTIGFLFVFLGLQLNLIETYVLTPNATKFWAERFELPDEQTAYNGYNSTNYGTNYSNPYAQAGYQYGGSPFQSSGFAANSPRLMPTKQITPADWLCWPVIFLGVAFVLHGAAVRRGP